jgi:hypothetical protein
MSGLSEERQQELIESGNITSEEIERLRELEKEEKEKQKVCEGQLTFEEEVVSESDTEIEQEDIDVVEEVVSESDTEFDPDDYEKVAWSDEIGAEINRRICELVFDDDNFPKEVMEELTAKENREAEYFRSIMRVALPFETDRIRLEYDFGFKSYFKDDMTVITVPLWKMWVYFADRYKLYAQSKSDTVIPDSSTSAQDGETPRFKVINNRGYCKPDVEQLLSQYKGMVRNIESQIQSQNASKGDIQNLQKATIIQDALEYFLDNYDEVREKYLKS